MLRRKSYEEYKKIKWRTPAQRGGEIDVNAPGTTKAKSKIVKIHWKFIT